MPHDDANVYEKSMRLEEEFIRLQNEGRTHIRASDLPFESNRQARIRYYLQPEVVTDTVLQDWRVFVAETRQATGKHRHQGGVILYILQGDGYSEIDGERVEWSTDDLIILPIKPNGVVHQHFTKEPGQVCRWLAFYFFPLYEWTAGDMEQIEPIAQSDAEESASV